MCGFVGVLDAGAIDLKPALSQLRHRGPDDEKTWSSEGLKLGFRRLSIIDPTGPGQPVSDGQSALVLNGEIYNYRELAEELGIETRSDAEAAFHALKRWGTGALDRFNGIFALAFWDGERVILARDRVGVKPLFYARLKGGWAFSSGTRALLSLGVSDELDTEAITSYLSLLWAPGPLSPFKEIKKVPPGTIVVLPEHRVQKWWKWRPEPGTTTEEQTNIALEAAAKQELVSDVPLGIFLSGGLDSSLVAFMAGEPLPAFTLSPEPQDLAADIYQDESLYAEMVARTLGMPLTKVKLRPQIHEIEKLISKLEEPLGDPASIAIYLLSLSAKQQGIKTVLSGVGGDELFGGYPRHRAFGMAVKTRHLPGFVRGLIARLPGSAGRMGRLRRDALKLLRAKGSPGQIYLSFFYQSDREELSGLFRENHRQMDAWERMLLGGFEEKHDSRVAALSFDINYFLPENNLAYTDYASMAASVEVRVPLLNPRVLEAARGLSSGQLMGKKVLRKIAENNLPKEIIQRPKAGLGSPVRGWIRTWLYPWIQEQIWGLPDGLLDKELALKWLKEEKQGKGFRYLSLWALATLSVWLRTR